MKKLAIVALLAVAATALQIPIKSKDDSRVSYAKFNKGDVYKINCKNGFSTVIEFSKGENVINTASGFSDGWELTPRGNFLFVRPKVYVSGDKNSQEAEIIEPTPATWHTNLIVTTSKYTYVFDLNLVYKKQNTTYKLEFSYPNEEAKLEAKNQELFRTQSVQNAIKKNLNDLPVPRNWDLVMHVNKGSEKIAPIYAYDDGAFTYLGFDSTKEIPSVFAYDSETKQETIVNSAVRVQDSGVSLLVIFATQELLLLRSGDLVVGIKNNGLHKNPKTRKTSNEKVERVVND